MIGTMHDELITPKILKMYWLTALWVPLLPISVYLVEGQSGNAYRFYAELGIFSFHSVYRRKLLRFYATVLIESVLWLLIAFAALSVAAFAFGLIRSCNPF